MLPGRYVAVYWALTADDAARRAEKIATTVLAGDMIKGSGLVLALQSNVE